jgi:hypothetical protein
VQYCSLLCGSVPSQYSGVQGIIPGRSSARSMIVCFWGVGLAAERSGLDDSRVTVAQTKKRMHRATAVSLFAIQPSGSLQLTSADAQ